MGTKTRVEDGIVFEDDDGGFHRIKRGAAARENRPSRGESAATTGLAGLDGFVRNVPRAAMNDQRRFH